MYLSFFANNRKVYSGTVHHHLFLCCYCSTSSSVRSTVCLTEAHPSTSRDMLKLTSLAFLLPAFAAAGSATSSVATPAPTLAKTFQLKANITSGTLKGIHNATTIHNEPLKLGSHHVIGTNDSYVTISNTGSEVDWYFNLTSNDDLTLLHDVPASTYALVVPGTPDARGRRLVRATENLTEATHGFDLDRTPEGIVIVVLNPPAPRRFGSWYTCPNNHADGVRLFYRDVEQKLPHKCADLNLIPQCVATNAETHGQDSIPAECYPDVDKVD
nr:hypothetical protein CFP56_07743 [Quercus suber]